MADAPEADGRPHRRFQHYGTKVGLPKRACKLQGAGRALQQKHELGRNRRND
jgi:hypothetical protein